MIASNVNIFSICTRGDKIKHNTPLVIAVDPGTRHIGVALTSDSYGYDTFDLQLPIPVREAGCSYEEFSVIINHSAPGTLIKRRVQELGEFDGSVVTGNALVEQPTRKYERSDREHKDRENFVRVKIQVRYWVRWLTELSPFLLVEKVDALRWQNQLVAPLARRMSLGMEAATNIVAASYLCDYGRISSPHIADAVCLAEFAKQRQLAVG